MDFFNTIAQAGEAEYNDRGSKFLAYAFPIADAAEFKKRLTALKKEHPKAAHFCFAYRLRIDGNNFRVTDDGEPAGSAGKPILGQIDSREVVDLAIVVVRYFGGTLLGVPGLINAYKMAALLVLQVVPIVQKPVLINYSIQFDYTQMHEVMVIVKQLNCVVLAQENQLFSLIKLGVPKNRKGELLYKLENLRNVEVAQLL